MMLKIFYVAIQLYLVFGGFIVHPPTPENQRTTGSTPFLPMGNKNKNGSASAQPLIDRDTTTVLPEYDWIVPDMSPLFSLTKQHERVCFREQNIGQILETPFPCCGSCSNDDTCYDYGNCCLGKFRDFNTAAVSTSNTLYRCLPAKWRPEGNGELPSTGSYWMISKCPGLAFTDLQQLCENPGLDRNVSSITPVTDALQGVTYRNIFCAQCNGRRTESDVWVNWKLQIFSDELIMLPDNDLLSQIKSSRGVRPGIIHFIPPKYLKTETCRIIPYQVSECNVTGQWRSHSRYKEYIEQACLAFVDPFNATYRNYFCYLCNQADADSVQPTCVNSLGSNPEPVVELYKFRRLVDVVDTVIGQNSEESPRENCSVTQFKDTRLMRCLNVDCHTEDSLVNGVCHNVKQKDICYVFMMLITPEEDMLIDGLDYQDFGDYLRDLLRDYYGWDYWETVTEMKMFYRVTGTNSTNRFIVTLMLDFALTNASVDEVATILVIHETKNFLPMSILSKEAFVEDGLALLVELASHNLSSLERDVFYFRDFFDSADLLEMRLLITVIYVESGCLLDQAVLFNKLRICPFVRVGIHDLPFYFNQGHRFFNDSLYYILEWQFEILGDEIQICLEDYLPINVEKLRNFQSISTSATSLGTTIPGSSGAPDSDRPVLAFTNVCLFVLLRSMGTLFG